MGRPPLEEFARRMRGLRAQAELDAATVEALNAFDAAGVQYLLLKGAALGRLLYTHGRRRGYSDVDLLVAPDALASAGRVLSELGYTNTTASWGIADVAGAVHADVWVRRNQAIGPLMIDLHSRLAGVQASPQVAWDALAARRAWIELNGRRAAVLGREGLALHLATHAAQHGPDELKPLADLAYGLDHWPPEVWLEAAGLASELDAVGAFAAGLRLVPAGAVLAERLELPATDDVEWEMLHRGERPRGTFHMQAFADARGLRERGQVLRRSLLPSREWIVWQDPRAADSRPRLAAARARHILRAPAWAVRAWRFRRRARRAAR
jgi:hypothetical protein